MKYLNKICQQISLLSSGKGWAVLFFVLLFNCTPAYTQFFWKKNTKYFKSELYKYRKKKYKKDIFNPKMLCNPKGRKNKRKTSTWFTQKSEYVRPPVPKLTNNSKAVADKVETRQTSPTNQVKKEPEKTNAEVTSPTKEDNQKTAVDKQELKVLPEPISEKHALIRKKVTEKLSQQKPGEPIELESLFFIFGEDEFAVLDMEPFLMAVEYALQGKIIFIEGYSDNIGNDKANLELSMKRVSRLKSLMLDIGVPDERISVIGYGEANPKYSNATEEGRTKNRRADFKAF